MAGTIVPQKLIDDVAENTNLTKEDSTFALQYLNYYYQDPQLGPLTEDKVTEHVVRIQSQLGLPQDGILDTPLVKTMEHAPRCGFPDYIKMAEGPLAAKWGRKQLTYFVEQYVSGVLTSADQEALMAKAFQQWADVADLGFTRTNARNSANIVISIGRGAADQFDGPGNTLAYAYLPSGNNYQGQLIMKFDYDETWIKDANSRGILYLNVACHEFGHLLGLDHSSISSALMAPYYAIKTTKPQAQDDIPRIQGLYGRPTAPPPTNPPPTTPGTYKLEIDGVSLSQIKINGKTLALNDTSFDLI